MASDPTAVERLREILLDSFMDVAELAAEADEAHQRTLERAQELRQRMSGIWKMGGLGEPPVYEVERKVRRLA